MGPRVRTFDLRSSLDISFRQRGRARLLNTNITPLRKTALNNELAVQVLLIAGGGGGGGKVNLVNGGGGGGGAGGVAYFEDNWLLTTITDGTDDPADFVMNIVVGAGGAKASGSSGSFGSAGAGSSIEDGSGAVYFVQADGGGGGGSSNIAGRSGGSGGGGGGSSVASRAGGPISLNGFCCPPSYDGTTDLYGGSGGAGQTASPYRGGGGGGGGGTGATGSASGAGGAGYSFNGTTYSTGGKGASVGVGSVDGTINSGNGGDGAAPDVVATGGNGGSGIVIISYAGPPVVRYGLSSNGSNYGEMYTAAGRTYHVFKASGQFYMGDFVSL